MTPPAEHANTAAAERGRILAVARRWFDEGRITRAERGAICAAVLIYEDPPTEVVREMIRAELEARYD